MTSLTNHPHIETVKRASLRTMQRLHQYDLAGLLIESGEWNEISLPAIATDDVAVPLTRDRVHRRRIGEALHPAREPYEELMRIKRSVGSVIFAAQYQQLPVPAEGNMIRSEWLGTYAQPLDRSKGGQVAKSWDTASKDGLLNDWSVCVTALVRRRQMFVIDIWRRKVSPFNLGGTGMRYS